MLLPSAIKRRVLEYHIKALQNIEINDPTLSEESKITIQRKFDEKIDKLKAELRKHNEPKNGTNKDRSKLVLSRELGRKLEENPKTTIRR